MGPCYDGSDSSCASCSLINREVYRHIGISEEYLHHILVNQFVADLPEILLAYFGIRVMAH